MRDMVLFFEEQRFRRTWIIILTLGAAAGAFAALAFAFPALAEAPPPGLLAAGLGAFAASILAPALIMLSKLTTEVRAEGIYVRFHPFHRTARFFPFVLIAQAFARDYRPIREYGGWGIRYGPSGRAFNISGHRGVQLVLRDGTRLLIGSQRADELALAIEAGRKGDAEGSGGTNNAQRQ